MTTITDDMISCWRVNYGLDTRSPEDAMRMWNDQFNGMAPAGAVAALGLALQHIDQLRADLDALRDQIRAIGKARDRFGWSPEVDEVIEAARKVAE